MKSAKSPEKLYEDYKKEMEFYKKAFNVKDNSKNILETVEYHEYMNMDDNNKIIEQINNYSNKSIYIK